MRNISVAVAVCLMGGYLMISEAIAADETDLPLMKRGSISDQDANAEREAKLKARIKAINEKSRHEEAGAETPVPLERRSARGSDQIKAKMKAARESKSGQWLQDWYHDITKGMEAAESKRKDTFKKKLAQEKARRMEKKKARENSQ